MSQHTQTSELISRLRRGIASASDFGASTVSIPIALAEETAGRLAELHRFTEQLYKQTKDKKS